MGNRSRMHNGKDSRRYYDWLDCRKDSVGGWPVLSAGGISLPAGNRKSAQGIYPVKVRCAGRWTQPDLAVPSGKKIWPRLSSVVWRECGPEPVLYRDQIPCRYWAGIYIQDGQKLLSYGKRDVSVHLCRDWQRVWPPGEGGGRCSVLRKIIRW